MENTENKVEKKVIKKSEILEMRNEGKTKKEIADYYGLPVTKMTSVFNQLNIKGRPKAKPDFELVIQDDTQKPEEFSTNTEDVLRDIKESYNEQ